MFAINDIKKRQGGLDFEETLMVKDDVLVRNPEILDVSEVQAKGNISYENGLYLLTYQLSYQLTLPSSRSMTPVVLSETYLVTEAFVENTDSSHEQEMIAEELVLVIEGNHIILKDSVIDNILLNIPLRVLTAEEAADHVMPSGDSWTVLSQDEYEEQQAQKRQENSPFAALSGFLEEDDDN